MMNGVGAITRTSEASLNSSIFNDCASHITGPISVGRRCGQHSSHPQDTNTTCSRASRKLLAVNPRAVSLYASKEDSPGASD